MKRLILTMVIALISVNINFAQNYKAIKSNSKLSVTGTSTLHDWECEVEDFTGAANVEVANGVVTKISDFNFSFKVKSLESGKGAMNKKVYEALKEDDNPTVSYKGQKVVIENGKATFYGQMTMAGVTKSFETPVTVSYNGGKVTLKGEKAFKLSEFNMEPPTAMFGTIKTGEEVAIHYEIQLTK